VQEWVDVFKRLKCAAECIEMLNSEKCKNATNNGQVSNWDVWCNECIEPLLGKCGVPSGYKARIQLSCVNDHRPPADNP
jgi:hypothetical protein